MARLDRITGRPRILLGGFGVAALMALVIATLPSIVAGSTSESDSIQATASVKLLASRLYKASATPAGSLTPVLTVGKVSARVMCKDDGAGQIRVKVLFRSSIGGTVLLASNGSLSLNNSYQTAFEAFSAAPFGYASEAQVLTPGGTFQHWNAAYTVNRLGADCAVHLTVSNA